MQKWKNEINLCVFVMKLPSLDDKKKKSPNLWCHSVTVGLISANSHHSCSLQ